MRYLQSRQCLYILLLSLLFAFSSSSLSSPSYTSVTALDKYGNSVQLENAREAASRHGRLIVAARASGNVTVVVSLYTCKTGILTSSKQVLQQVWMDDACFLACTGVKADATWLVTEMRAYCKQVWERYNVDKISPLRMAQAVSQVLLQFMGYDREKEWKDGVSPSTEEWARPLGIQTLIVSPSMLILVEPSGIAQTNLEHVAIGKDGGAVSRAMRERYDPAASLQEVQDLILQIIRETVGQRDDKTELIIEVVTNNGVETSSAPLQQDNNAKLK